MPPKKEGLSATLVRAKSAGTRLKKSTDELNTGIRRLEQELADLGVRASVSFSLPNDDAFGSRGRILSFGKHQREWCFAVEEGETNGFGEAQGEWDVYPLLNCSREVRLAAVDLLPELVKTLAERVEQEAAAVGEKSKQLSDFVAELGSPSTSSTSDEDLPF